MEAVEIASLIKSLMPESEKHGVEKLIEMRHPDWSEDQKLEAVEQLREYLKIVLRIYERVSADPEESAKLEMLLDEHRKKKAEEGDPERATSPSSETDKATAE